MKRCTSFLLAVVLLLSLMPTGFFSLTAYAETSGYYTYSVSNGEATITDCSSSISGAITIPSTLGGYPVTSIGHLAFYDCSGLTSVTIGDSVTSIGEGVFAYCTNLNEIQVSENHEHFSCDSNGVLFNKDKTELIMVPNGGIKGPYSIPVSVSIIGNRAFVGCQGLTSITIPDSVTIIGDGAFGGCQGLTSITIPDNVTIIGDSAFSGCQGLTSISIPDSVTRIGDGAFDGCTSLLYNTYDNAKYLGNSENPYLCLVEANDYKIKSYEIHNTTKIIGSGAFDWSGITSITIPDSVTHLGPQSFEGCTELRSITIPDSVVSIDESAFNFCYRLTSVTIGDGVISIGARAFDGCDQLTGVSIPDSVTSIGEKAFYNCTKLANVTIGDSVTSIGDYAFFNCKRLTSVKIPDSVTNLGTCAFTDCIKLESVTIGNGLTSINYGAFKGCSSLSSVTIPDGVTNIGRSAFSDCVSLTSVMIPDSVTSIDIGAFSRCTSLTSVTIPDSVTKISGSAFAGCTSLTAISIPDSVTLIDPYAFNDCTNLATIAIGGNLTEIGYLAFCECTNLTTIEIGGSLAKIGESAFYECNNLEHVWYGGSEENRSNIMIKHDNTCLENATWHYNCCGPQKHSYDSVCDMDCNACGYERADYHVYENSCDTDCNECGAVRSTTHAYDHACDAVCNICGYERTVPDHVYKNNCDTTCNVCGVVRSITHTYDYICDDTCNVCGYKRDASHIYDNADDVTCNVCKQTLAPAAPKAESVTDNTVTLVAVEGYEYSKDGSTWQKSNVFIGLEPGCSYKFFQRVAQTEDNLASPASSPLSVTTDKRMPEIPEDFTILELTDTSVTLNEITGCEYSMDGINWQINPVFTGLTPSTRYTFYQRIAEGSKNYASDSAVLYITTYSKLGTITYNPNGGQNAPESTTGIVSSTAPTRSGYRFVGWALSPNTFAVYSPGDHCSQQEDIVLYASWAKLCDTCDGEVNYKTTCYSCLGSGVGRYTCSSCGGVGYFNREETCSADYCYGGTYVYGGVVKKCSTCKGRGLVTKKSDCTKCSNGQVSSTCRTCWGPGYINRECEQCALGVQKFTPEAPEMPKLQSVSKRTVVLVGYSTCEYSMDGRNWQDSNVFSDLDSNTQYVFYQRYKAKRYTDHSDASPALSVTTHRDGVMPSPPPVLQSKTYNQVVLKPIAGCEYSIDGINWQESNIFDGLEADAQYTIYQRYMETSTHLAGLTSEPLIVRTDAPPYTSGDVNDDGKINSLDGLILLRYLNGWDITINSEEAMDVNADGKINSLDGLILMRYLNGWNVTLG